MLNYLVTGADHGLGLGLVKVLASDPFNTVIGLVGNEHAVHNALDPENKVPPNVFLVVADGTELPAMKLAAQRAEALLGGEGLDIVIHTAIPMNSAETLRTLENFESSVWTCFQSLTSHLDSNVLSVLKTIQCFLPLVRKGNVKRFITISNDMGNIDFMNQVGTSEAPGDAVSKDLLLGLMARLNETYGDQGILFGTISREHVTSYQHVEEVPAEAVARFTTVERELAEHAPHQNQEADAISAAKRVVAAIERATREAGYGGIFIRNEGTSSWM